MDHNTIDHIMSAVNGMNGEDEDMGYLMRSLQHRTPPTSTLSAPRNDINKPTVKLSVNAVNAAVNSTVNRPVDPVQSVSSNENFSQSPEADFDMQYEAPVQPLQPIRNNVSRNLPAAKTHNPSQNGNGSDRLIKLVKKPNSISDANTNTNQTTTSNGNAVVGGNPVPIPAHLTNIMGYNIPTTTLYFIIILIIIAVALYFLTGEKKKPAKQEPEKEHERDTRHDQKD